MFDTDEIQMDSKMIAKEKFRQKMKPRAQKLNEALRTKRSEGHALETRPSRNNQKQMLRNQLYEMSDY